MSEFSRDQLSQELMKDFQKEDEEELFSDDRPTLPVKVLFPLILIAVAAFASYAVYTDKIAISPKNAEAPLVLADKTPVRERPEDPGGMQIANQDKQVYDAIASNKERKFPKVIRLAPQPEEPVKRENIGQEGIDDFAALLEDLKKNEPEKIEEPKLEPIEDNVKELAKLDKKELLAKLQERRLVAKQELMSKDVAVVDEVEQSDLTVSDIKNTPVPVKRAEKEVSTKKEKGYKIQLGAYRSQDEVQKNWNSIKGKYPSLLGGVDMDVEKADLGNKGVFYRLQVTSLGSETKARKLCQQLLEKQQGCFVVK